MLNEDQVDTRARYGMMSAGILAGIAASQAQNTCLRELKGAEGMDITPQTDINN